MGRAAERKARRRKELLEDLGVGLLISAMIVTIVVIWFGI